MQDCFFALALVPRGADCHAVVPFCVVCVTQPADVTMFQEKQASQAFIYSEVTQAVQRITLAEGEAPPWVYEAVVTLVLLSRPFPKYSATSPKPSGAARSCLKNESCGG